jgi:hypothetical protein
MFAVDWHKSVACGYNSAASPYTVLTALDELVIQAKADIIGTARGQRALPVGNEKVP